MQHNFTRDSSQTWRPAAVGKQWEGVTDSAAIALPAVGAALKNDDCERLILLAHSQGTILSAMMLELLKGL